VAYTTPSTHPNSYIVTSTDWAIQVNNDKFFHGPPTVRVVRAAAQSLASGTFTAIAFSSKDWDTNTMFATTGTKVTCKTAGKFLVTFSGGFQPSTAGSNWLIGVRKNSTGTAEPNEFETILSVKRTASAHLVGSISGEVALSTGQFIEGVMYQDTGGSINTSTQAGRRPKLSMLWVSS